MESPIFLVLFLFEEVFVAVCVTARRAAARSPASARARGVSFFLFEAARRDEYAVRGYRGYYQDVCAHGLFTPF